MAAQKIERRRKRTRKARTEVSSASSSSSSGEESDAPPPTRSDIKDTVASSEGDDGASSDHSTTTEDQNPAASAQSIKPTQSGDPEQAFEDIYLKQATREFSSDLDKLRTAPDFKDSSVPILIQALRQGTACFSREERQKVGSAVPEPNLQS